MLYQNETLIEQEIIPELDTHIILFDYLIIDIPSLKPQVQIDIILEPDVVGESPLFPEQILLAETVLPGIGEKPIIEEILAEHDSAPIYIEWISPQKHLAGTGKLPLGEGAQNRGGYFHHIEPEHALDGLLKRPEEGIEVVIIDSRDGIGERLFSLIYLANSSITVT